MVRGKDEGGKMKKGGQIEGRTDKGGWKDGGRER